MGRNKALMLFRGKPLIQRVVERVRELGDEVIVVTNHVEDFDFLTVRIEKDIIQGYGPLGGFLTAFAVAQNPFVLIVACDMPFVNPLLLEKQKEILTSGGFDVVVPVLENGLEPFHAVYRRDICLLKCQLAVDAGERRAISWFDQVNVRGISDKEILKLDPHMLSFFNINTVVDLEEAERKDE